MRAAIIAGMVAGERSPDTRALLVSVWASAGFAILSLVWGLLMVAVISAAFLWVPARLLAGGLREVLTMAPARDVQERLWACVREVQASYGFVESFPRSSKVGCRVDVEIDFVVGEGSRAHDVWAFDTVRQDLADRLAELPYPTSVAVAFTADRRWAL